MENTKQNTNEIIKLTDMLCCNVHIEATDEEWYNLHECALFRHSEACEYILYIADGENFYNDLAPQFLKACEEARKQGYHYICIYNIYS